MIDKLQVTTGTERHEGLKEQTDGDLLKFNKGAEPCTWKGPVSYNRYTGDWLAPKLSCEAGAQKPGGQRVEKSQQDALCSHES